MEKKTIWIFVITIVVVFAFVFVQQLITSSNEQSADTTAEAVQETVVEEVIETQKLSSIYHPVSYSETRETFTVETDYVSVDFDTKGASVSSIKMKNYNDANGDLADVVFKGENDNNAFLLYWGNDIEDPVLDNFSYTVNETQDGISVVFTKNYTKDNGEAFTLTKTFLFKDGEYLFQLTVDVNGAELKESEYAFTIGYEPQVGPAFNVLKNNNYDYRRFYAGLIKSNGKVSRSTVKLSKNTFYSTQDFKWFSVTSKYFTVIGSPVNQEADYLYQATQGSGDISQTNGFFISVPSDETEASSFYYYCGPQLKTYLGSYYSGTDNAWGIRGLNLDDAMESGSMLGWLENILKALLQLLYKIIPNYGVGIILVTLILKIVLWPLTKKSMASTAKMQALTPQLNEIKTKYADNPQKQNMEIQALYKENGVSTLGGCLPMLIQFPILIAFYGLLNKHFELRGAMFIPGWITDLSVPETIATLGFSIPFIGNEIHLLPIIYTVSMIFSMKFTQASNANSAGPNKSTTWLMTWGMPIMFFFVLYSAPSGLLLYWTVQNALSILQQVYTNSKVFKDGLQKESAKPKKESKAVLKYQEKLKALEAANKNNKKGKK
ncbi:MAG: membrane protein insertase YidC [Sphaerochaetaceae bacterium]|nr:membrane protein insertase YidC [Sphaerochaetaceae bacterium]